MRRLLSVLVLLGSCQRSSSPIVVEPSPDRADADAIVEHTPPPSEATHPELAPGERTAAVEPAVDTPAEPAEPTPPPTWDWALSVVPTLSSHSQESVSPEAYERFTRWFAGQGERTIYFRDYDQCHPVKGSPDDGFRYREKVTTEGKTRTRTSYSFDISAHGITQSGPGGTTYERDARGRWQEVSGFGVGCFEVLVHDSMSRVEDGIAYFDAYAYRLTPRCAGTHEEVQSCEGGGTRTCSRCTGIWLQPQAPNRGWGRAAAIGVRGGPSVLHDCSQPCPPDEWTPRIEPLREVLAGRTFYDRSVEDEGVLFLSAKACRRAAARVRAQSQSQSTDE